MALIWLHTPAHQISSATHTNQWVFVPTPNQTISIALSQHKTENCTCNQYKAVCLAVQACECMCVPSCPPASFYNMAAGLQTLYIKAETLTKICFWIMIYCLIYIVWKFDLCFMSGVFICCFSFFFQFYFGLRCWWSPSQRDCHILNL